MASSSTTRPLLLSTAALLFLCASASPTPTAHLVHLDPRAPAVTAPPALPHDPLARRNIISDFESGVDSILSELGNVPKYVASGIAPFFQGFPTGSQVQSSLSLSSTDLDALPTQALNIPPYANYTKNGWNVRFHGNIYKQPDVSNSTLNDLANIFLPDVDIKNLPQSQADQARNLTAEIFIVQQGDVNVSAISLQGAGGSQEITLPYPTTDEGDFDVFLPIDSTGLDPGDETSSIQTLDTFVTNTTLGNATAYLVPNTGMTIISDIDDILRVTKIYEPEKGLLNSFARPFTPWMNMPDIYANWSQSLPDTHFHYLTTTPEQITRNYMSFIYATYPLGSFDTRPLNFSDISATLAIRKFLLDKIFLTFPQRKFILVADTSNSDVMSDYPQLAHQYPEQVQCIFLRNTSATDSGDKFPYNTSGFKGLPQHKYMFFVVPDDLSGLDIAGGHCYNSSIPQNISFGYQGLPFGLGSNAGGRVGVSWSVVGMAVLGVMAMVW